MSKCNKIFACIQTFVILFLMICHGGSVISNAKKSGAFPCAGHQCGCKSEVDCKTHCCCAPDENRNKFRNNSENQTGFKTFISSINCKYGNDPLTISFTAKYILERQDTLTKESFLCFLFNDLSIRLSEVFVALPEKPPRHYL
ncbi:MAG: hypothetical protein HW406_711 [Candidatus Brocadiaceae bacterium]|nr:hypothetical protein [Candidatus Brocadiaceae bacterium]